MLTCLIAQRREPNIAHRFRYVWYQLPPAPQKRKKKLSVKRRGFWGGEHGEQHTDWFIVSWLQTDLSVLDPVDPLRPGWKKQPQSKPNSFPNI